MGNPKIIPVALRERSDLLAALPVGRQAAIISVPPVARHYKEQLRESLKGKLETIDIDVSDGELSKSLTVSDELFDWLIRNRFERSSTILALGGGVVGDLAGFVAATYLRGVNLIQIPTSLLAQVDSSIGGKVGVNHTRGKNLIGAFYQPRFVLADNRALSTLPQAEFVCGLGEVVKYAIIRNEGLYEDLNGRLADLHPGDTEHLEHIVKICASIKAGIVSRDETESGERADLNFGHTFGHALETYFNFQGLKHGQAVLLGMRCAVYMSVHRGLISDELAADLTGFIKQVDFPLPSAFHEADPDALVEIMRFDKKVRDGKINVMLLEAIGKLKREPVDDLNLLKKVYTSLLEEEH
jgi:3-dehydroquinate synthase